ncbi:DUF185-domain-containing protein [Durotheca rogersii]|uniref:DUF185-domain-containing protein n=1 Tax=Durotheca rogersii TaxID=419775 RepID=UPI002220BBD2|nr:DUF185-domain-containing protein [Durotheca rogersii]KAI5863153.1 DUF185-domain-containing protein [Durotheca rogersii]
MRPNLLRPASACWRVESNLLRQPASSVPSVWGSRNFAATPACKEKQWSTPLAKQLTEAIKITGPIPLASYMRMCLTSDVGGYYTGGAEKGRDQFSEEGDFITSPEISQIFGELVGIWFVAEWISQGSPKQGVHLIEVGPGKGTLMDDMLRTMNNFKEMAANIEAVYLVEASAELRLAQKNLLCGEDAVMTESKMGWHATSKYAGLPIVWTDAIKAIPQDPTKTPFIVAHEFFDALPIHAFQLVKVSPGQQQAQTTVSLDPASSAATTATSAPKTSPGYHWREMVVTRTPPLMTHDDLGTPPAQRHEPVSEFQLTLSPAMTRHSQYLPESSPRYRALKSTPGAIIEVCPDAALYVSDFAQRIGGGFPPPRPPASSSSPQSTAAAAAAAAVPIKPRPSGAALIIDYGPSDTVPANSLRGISRHRRVSPFAAPGRVDLSADVDFMALAEAATRASPGVECHGPVDQAHFLEAMGVRHRAAALAGEAVAAAGGIDEKAAHTHRERIDRSLNRLLDRGPGGMGKVYKVFAILPEHNGERRPVGFGGDVDTGSRASGHGTRTRQQRTGDNEEEK